MTVPDRVRAFRLTGPERFEIVEKAVPQPAPGSSLARPAFVGLCGTDLDLYDGTMPYFAQGAASYPLQPGHEWSGTLLEPVDVMGTGTPIILDAVVSCGRPGCCPGCRAWPRPCSSRRSW